MAATVGDVLREIFAMAPPELAEGYDNVGLLAGRPDCSVNKVLVALDVTHALLDEALAVGAQLIVSHHPLMFHARRNLREDDPEGALICRLVRERLSLIAAHTNYDNAAPGVADALAEELGLIGVQPLPHGLRMGELAHPMSDGELCVHVRKRLGGSPRLTPRGSGVITRVAVCGGAGGSLWQTAVEAGAQAYVTGEFSYHNAQDAAAGGVSAIDAGHRETELPGVRALASGLQNRLNALQYSVVVVTSASASQAR